MALWVLCVMCLYGYGGSTGKGAVVWQYGPWARLERITGYLGRVWRENENLDLVWCRLWVLVWSGEGLIRRCGCWCDPVVSGAMVWRLMLPRESIGFERSLSDRSAVCRPNAWRRLRVLVWRYGCWSLRDICLACRWTTFEAIV